MPIKERYWLIKDVGFDGVLLWWSEYLGRNEYRSGPQIVREAGLVDDDKKRHQEINSLRRIPGSFKKIVVVKDDIMPWNDDNGILYIGIKDFLLDPNAINM